MLLFEQIPIDIQFKYYTYIPSIAEDNNAGQGYTATSQEAIIQKDSVVTLTQGNDTIGYRFDGYTYVAPKSYAGSKEFVLTELNQTQQQFTITDEILSYLSTIEVVENKIPLVVYVNYVKQYTYEIEYKCNVAQVSANITNNATGDVMSQYVYYDYGTPLNIAIKTADTKHYKLDVVLTKSGTDEEINTSTISSVDVVAGSVIQTNLDNLAGFTAIRELTDHYVITIDIVVEKYDTKLNQYLNNGNAGIDEQSSSLQAKGDTLFNLADNVYYKVSDTVTHEYESAVEISIYVLKPQNTESQYYTLSEVKLNGITLNVQLTGETELEGKASYVYTFEYVLQGDELPTEQALDIYFNAIYYVSMGIG